MIYKAEAALLLVGLIFIANVYAQSSCRTPNREAGNCINLKQCQVLLNLLTSSQRTPSDIEYLRRSQCGFNNRDPLVCCPLNNNDGNQNNNNGGNNNWNNGGNNGEWNRPNNNNGGNNRPNDNNGGQGIDNKNKDAYTSNLLPADCGKDLSNRIVGGNVTELDEFPWMVLLEYRRPNGKVTACGGALISKRYVLTAAHCVKGRAIPSTWTLTSVRLGEYNTATDRDCIPDGNDGEICSDDPVSVRIEEQIVHEDYAPYSNDQRYDISLLRLAQDVTFTNFIKPICLPSNSNLNNKLTVAGWGKTESKSESEIKLKVSLPIVDKEQCSERYRNAGVSLGEGQICAGGEQGIDSCRGDSGGPLMQQERKADGTRVWVCVGVVSFGPSPCGMPGWPGVYTKVYDYMPWIVNKLRP